MYGADSSGIPIKKLHGFNYARCAFAIQIWKINIKIKNYSLKLIKNRSKIK